MAKDTRQQEDTRRLPEAGRDKAAKHSGNFLGHLFGSLIGKIIVVVVIVVVAAYSLIAKIESLNPFGSRTTITTTVVLGKLTKIEQVHVATRSYAVDVKITQSVGVIPCFLVCNQMELKGSGTDDAIVNLSQLSQAGRQHRSVHGHGDRADGRAHHRPRRPEPGHLLHHEHPWGRQQRDAGLQEQPERLPPALRGRGEPDPSTRPSATRRCSPPENRAPGRCSPRCSVSSASRR